MSRLRDAGSVMAKSHEESAWAPAHAHACTRCVPDLVGLQFALLQGSQLHCLQVGFVLLSVPCALLLVCAAALRSLLPVPLALHLVLHKEAVHVELHLLQVAVQERLPPYHGARHGQPAPCVHGARSWLTCSCG